MGYSFLKLSAQSFSFLANYFLKLKIGIKKMEKISSFQQEIIELFRYMAKYEANPTIEMVEYLFYKNSFLKHIN